MFRKKKQNNLNHIIKVEDSHAEFAVIEAFNSLAVNLMYTMNGTGTKKVALTSSIPHEGKSMISYNLASTFVQQGQRVLVIDTDMRCPTQQKYFNCSRENGLSDVLCGLKTYDEVVKTAYSEEFKYISAGMHTPNPLRLLSSGALKELVESVESQFDYIIFDASPIGIVTDSLMLKDIVDGYIVVVDQTSTKHPLLANSISTLQHAGVEILGVVINNFDYMTNEYIYSNRYSNKYNNYYVKANNSDAVSDVTIGTVLDK